MLRPFCVMIAVLCLISPVAAAGIVLEQKYEEGTKFDVHADERQTFKFSLLGMDYESITMSFTRTTVTIGHRANDEILKIEEKTNSLQSESTIPGGTTLRFDSSDPLKRGETPELESILESLRTQCLPLTIEVDATNKIRQVSLPEGEFEKLTDSSKVQFKPESLKKTADGSRAFLPDEPVNKGDTWERSSEVQLGSGHMLTFLIQYQYDGTIEQDGMTLHKITGKAKSVSYTVDEKSSTPLKAEETKVTESQYVYLFDRELGALISRSSKVQIAGKLTINADGTPLDGTFDLTMEEKANRQKDLK